MLRISLEIIVMCCIAIIIWKLAERARKTKTTAMSEQMRKEIEYLSSLCITLLPDDNPFLLPVGEGKYISVVSYDDEFEVLSKITNYRDIYRTMQDLCRKLEYSIEEAIDLIYNPDYYNSFSVMKETTEYERKIYYYLENAMFRLEALWDMLAQFYNIKEGLGLEIRRVYHNKIFSNKQKELKTYWNNNPSVRVQNIIDYIHEPDDTEGEGRWKGNYRYINDLRNKMTHKYSIGVTNMSDYAFETKAPPAYIIKRVCESYADLQSFICHTIKDVLNEIEQTKEK